MFETELKFRIPPAQRDAVLRAVATASARRVRLQAVYFDTPDFALARARMALRLRKEGRVWVQTLKASGGLLARLEHEVRLPASAQEPALDLARHDGTPAGEALRAVLAEAPPLVALYRTDVQRTLRLVRVPGGTVEIACDRGHLLAGEGPAQRRAAVDEIEFELKSGAPAVLVALAARWMQRFGLWWDIRNKSEMGLRLANGVTQGPVVRARASAWADGATPLQVFRAALQDTLAQALPNAAELADGTGTPEHLHQLRVALRRMRTALRFFAPWSPEPVDALALQADWREPFTALGATRDADVMRGALGPRLQAAGAPPLDWPAAAGAAAPAEVVRSAAFNALLMRTLALALQEAAPDAPAAPPLAGTARELLRGAWRRIRRDIEGFAELDEAARHRLRRRLKRLRYALEFVAPAWPAKDVKRHAKALGPALEALGALNDLTVARALCAPRVNAEPGAAFAAGWLAAEQAHATEKAAQALLELLDTPRPWRG